MILYHEVNLDVVEEMDQSESWIGFILIVVQNALGLG